jgi:ABC-type phosphate/phosphonate transport system substrate-binding protein
VLKALHDGRADAGALGDLVWVAEQSAWRIDPTKVEVVWTTPPFDHCMFDAAPGAPKEKLERFQEGLFSMSWDDPKHRRVLELERLKKWMLPREEGYASLHEALDRDEK